MLAGGMRILEVTHYMPPHLGGIELVAASLAKGLRARGHKVRWIASANPGKSGWEGDRLRVPAWNLLEERAGLPYPLWSPRALLSLDREIVLADVVHVHDCLYMGSAFAVLAAKRLGKPVLVTQHIAMVPYGKVLDIVEGLAYATLGRAVLSRATKLVACAPHVPPFFRSLGVDKPFELIRNGIDEERFRLASFEERSAQRRARGLDERGKIVLFSGRLVAKKGVAKVASLQRRLGAEGITLVVCGEGPLAHLFEGVPRVHRLGAVPPERMPEVYSLADVFLLPSRGEGLPLGVQEAMFSGLDVVASEDEAFKDALSGAPGIRLADTEDELFFALKNALEGKARRELVRAFAVQRWGLTGFIDAYEAALLSIARGPR